MARVWRWLGVPLIGLAVAAVLAACAAPGLDPGEGPGDGTGPQAEFDRRAAEAAQTWRDGPAKAWRDGFVPLQDLTVVPAGTQFDEMSKLAFSAGWWRTRTEISSARPADGKITFAGGATMAVPLVPAATAYASLDQGDPPCPAGAGKPPTKPTIPPPADQPSADPGVPIPDLPTSSQVLDCTWLTATRVELGTTTLRTSRGDATVPAWLFTVAELPKPVARVAVAPSAVTPLPTVDPPGGGAAAGLVATQNIVSIDGAKLTYQLGVGACDTSITPLVSEQDDLVVIGGSVVRGTGICTDQLLLHPVSVTLRAPLGDRVVLDALTGQPMTIAPPR